MHCNICDRDLSDKEIAYNEDLKTYEPCTTCLDVAMDAAYTGGFKQEDDIYELLDDEFDYYDDTLMYKDRLYQETEEY